MLEKKYEGKRLTTFEQAFMEKERNDLSSKLESLQMMFDKNLSNMSKKIQKQYNLESSLSSGRKTMGRSEIRKL